VSLGTRLAKRVPLPSKQARSGGLQTAVAARRAATRRRGPRPSSRRAISKIVNCRAGALPAVDARQRVPPGGTCFRMSMVASGALALQKLELAYFGNSATIFATASRMPAALRSEVLIAPWPIPRKTIRCFCRSRKSSTRVPSVYWVTSLLMYQLP